MQGKRLLIFICCCASAHCMRVGFDNKAADFDITAGDTTPDHTAGDATPDPNADLVAFWHFDSVTDTFAADSSGNVNHGEVIGPVSASGWSGTGLAFDGEDDYVRVSESPSINSITHRITIAAWVKIPANDRDTILDRWFYDKNIGINDRSYVLVIEANGTICFGISSDGGYGWELYTRGIIPANIWTHVAATSDGELMKVFINGAQDRYVLSAPPGGIYISDREIHIGFWNAIERGGPEWSVPFSGTIDEIKLYRRALSADEIASLANDN